MPFLVPVCAQWVAGSLVHAHTVGVCFSREATEQGIESLRRSWEPHLNALLERERILHAKTEGGHRRIRANRYQTEARSQL
jgi:hypothetical protein